MPDCATAAAARHCAVCARSMLQDVLAGRPIEVEAIAGQVQLLARESVTPCPTLDAIVPLLRGLARASDGT